jgi:hypothetical protein
VEKMLCKHLDELKEEKVMNRMRGSGLISKLRFSPRAQSDVLEGGEQEPAEENIELAEQVQRCYSHLLRIRQLISD